MPKHEMIAIENVNTPGRMSNVDAEKYRAMRKVMLTTLPKRRPGLTQSQMIAAVRRHLPQSLWPGGAKSLWWVKTVQLDLEAKGLVERDPSCKPLRWFRA